MQTKITDLKKENNKLSRLANSLKKSASQLESENYIDMQDMRIEKTKLKERLAYAKRKLSKYANLGDDLNEKVSLEKEVEQLSLIGKTENCKNWLCYWKKTKLLVLKMGDTQMLCVK